MSDLHGNPATSSPLGKTDDEDEAGHLRRVADELGGANSGSVQALAEKLISGPKEERASAAAALGALGDRHAIAILRGLLESDEPGNWEVAVHGLRQSRDRSGWLCLESVALDNLHTLEQQSNEPLHAFRLLVMGRTKTMDRLFRAIDGHSRSISPVAARSFSIVAVSSVPGQMSMVMAMRLGLAGGVAASLEQVAHAMGRTIEDVRKLEDLAWETVQRSRPHTEIRANYEVNIDRLRTAD